MDTKTCPRCYKEKTLEEFGKDKSTKSGLCYLCKECRNKIQQMPSSKNYRKKYYKKYYKSELGKKILKKAQNKFINKITFCCKDCGTRISLITALYGQGRCKKCSRTLELRKIISNAQTGIKESKETCLKISNATKGKKNPRYINGLSLSPYNIEFSRELKQKIRERDNFTCQICGLNEKQHLKKYKCVLINHHIDYNKQNCKEDNLLSLCIPCHSKTNGTKEFDRDYWYAYCKYLIENK